MEKLFGSLYGPEKNRVASYPVVVSRIKVAQLPGMINRQLTANWESQQSCVPNCRKATEAQISHRADNDLGYRGQQKN